MDNEPVHDAYERIMLHLSRLCSGSLEICKGSLPHALYEEGDSIQRRADKTLAYPCRLLVLDALGLHNYRAL